MIIREPEGTSLRFVFSIGYACLGDSIRDYIRNNAVNWATDRLNQPNP